MVLLEPPENVFADVFPSDVRQLWCQIGTKELKRRLDVLGACGPYPTDVRDALSLRYLRAEKASWEAYLFTAYSCGMFKGDKGKDLYARLRGKDEDCFRSAMSECLACWFWAARMRMPVNPNAPGRNGKNLEMGVMVNESEVGVEVKAPQRDRVLNGVSFGDDSDIIAELMNNASKKFEESRSNLLLLVPRLRCQLFTQRRDLLKAAFGESKITWPVNMETGEGGPTEMVFFPEGKFLKTQRPGGRNLKHDGLPGNRRISAILVIEEVWTERYPFPNPFDLLDETRSQDWPAWERQRELHWSDQNCVWVDHKVLVVHNPHAYHPVSHDAFARFPQLVPVGDIMKWTDGAEVDV